MELLCQYFIHKIKYSLKTQVWLIAVELLKIVVPGLQRLGSAVIPGAISITFHTHFRGNGQ